MSRFIMISISALSIVLLSFPLLGVPKERKQSNLSLYSLCANMCSKKDSDVYFWFTILSNDSPHKTIDRSETFVFPKDKIDPDQISGFNEEYCSENHCMQNIEADITRIKESLEGLWPTYFDRCPSLLFKLFPCLSYYLPYSPFRQVLQSVRAENYGGQPVQLAECKHQIKDCNTSFHSHRSLGKSKSI